MFKFVLGNQREIAKLSKLRTTMSKYVVKNNRKINNPPFSQEELKRRYHYNPKTGIVTHRLDGNNQVKAGYKAGSPNPRSGHESIKINRVLYKTHKLIWYYMTGEWIQVDHKDLNGNNNKWLNLRKSTNSQNGSNKARKKFSKHPKGVTKHGNKYRASITVNYKRIWLGNFVTPEEAHEAYCKAAKILHGEFARLE